MTKMKYVLLAFGILLALAGSFALAASYATVFDGHAEGLIAGAVALSAGVLVLGQVFILRALDSLKACVERRGNEFAAAYSRSESQFESDAFAQFNRSDTGASASVPPAPLFAAPAPQVAASDFGLAQILRATPAPVEPASLDAFFPEDQATQIDPSTAISELPAILRAHGSRSQATRADIDATPGTPHIDSDLLLEAALALPPLAHTAPATAGAVRPTRETALPAAPDTTLRRSPTRASPTLSEMWRRVTAKTENSPENSPAPPEKVAEEPLPPPFMPEIASATVPDADHFSGTHETDNPHAAEDHAVEPELPRGGVTPQPSMPSAIDADLDHWFDRALVGVDEPAAPPAVAETSPEAQTERPNLAAGAEDWESSAAATETIAPPAGEPSEVGRYEADGTTYVMFSDGSIEARSEQGVYRFGSMAELKAFFEDQGVAH
jgi:hypothetical protein